MSKCLAISADMRGENNGGIKGKALFSFQE